MGFCKGYYCKNKYFIDSENAYYITESVGNFFTCSDIIFIIPLSEKKSCYIELFELCKTSKNRHLHTLPMYLRHVFTRSETMKIYHCQQTKIFACSDIINIISLRVKIFSVK